jgi:hypothetical protein
MSRLRITGDEEELLKNIYECNNGVHTLQHNYLTLQNKVETICITCFKHLVTHHSDYYIYIVRC